MDRVDHVKAVWVKRPVIGPYPQWIFREVSSDLRRTDVRLVMFLPRLSPAPASRAYFLAANAFGQILSNVCFGSKADMCSARRHVRFPRKRTFGGANGMSAQAKADTRLFDEDKFSD